MPAVERRVVHMALLENPKVRTQSVGVEPNRRIVVLPAGKVGDRRRRTVARGWLPAPSAAAGPNGRWIGFAADPRGYALVIGATIAASASPRPSDLVALAIAYFEEAPGTRRRREATHGDISALVRHLAAGGRCTSCGCAGGGGRRDRRRAGRGCGGEPPGRCRSRSDEEADRSTCA